MSLDIAPRPQPPVDLPDARVAPGHPLSPVTVRTPRVRPPRAGSARVGSWRPGSTRVRQAPARRRRAADAGLRIAPPRAASLTAAALTAGAASVLLAVVAVDAVASVAVFGLLLPLLLAAAAVGVARLASWLPLVATEWRGPLGYATAAQWGVLMFVAAAAPEWSAPGWVPVASGLVAAAPFWWSAVGPGRLRPRLRATPDAHGRRGALLAGAALALITASMLLPAVGVFLQAGLAVLLALAALTTRGLADAGATWDARRWAACVAGTGVAWAAGPLAATVDVVAWPAVSLLLVAAAGLPLVVVERPWRRARG